MSDASDTDDIESIREQKKEQLESELSDGASPDEPVHVEDGDHFADLTDDGVVLVDFHADWCGPCQMLEPTVEAIAAETDATVAKVDVDEHQPLAQQFNVQGVPTLVLFADGEAVEQLVGVQDEGTLVDLIEQYS
ncbi:thioredoxin [Halorientalis regularis]|jgi:thioredoxin 1|uniref:Thioredoxin n=1 Tax=Halorientalis regularis TaxID=660518 RepID=A0A1G7S634_9EURY|nr:thioredoxin [Halorientalis regularis]SDG18485.1 thioredoxin [Halorientalis regularis]